MKVALSFIMTFQSACFEGPSTSRGVPTTRSRSSSGVLSHGGCGTTRASSVPPPLRTEMAFEDDEVR